MGVPWRLALALQDDGWWLRSDIIWNKTNPMPNSAKDRLGMCHEYIFLLTKNSTYYYDWLAVREPVAESTKGRVKRGVSSKNKHANGAPGQTPHTMAQGRTNDPNRPSPSTRNRRTVWNVACKSVGENFFAAYPPKLIEPCVLAGSSEYGVCAECGSPWKRIIEPSPEYKAYLGKGYHDHSNDQAELISKEEKISGGQLGRPSGARFRTYERLKRFTTELEGTLFESNELLKAIDEIYRYPLRQSAVDTLNRQLRSGVSDEVLAELVIALRDEDRLCLIHEDEQEREPRIICSMGLAAKV